MFLQMLWATYLVFAGTQDLRHVVTLLWTFSCPLKLGVSGRFVHTGVAQFAFGFTASC